MMHFDKCIIENDRVRCTCDGKVLNGVLLTVGSEAVCNHVMTKMNGISTDTRDSSVSEKYSETSDAHNQLTKRQSSNSVSVNLTPEIAMNSSSIGTNSDNVIQIIQGFENDQPLLLPDYPIESIFEMAGNDIVTTPSNELLFDALKNNFALNDVMMDALSQTFKQTRNQLTKDVRYLKVMKPKSATALNEDTVCGQDDQLNEETPEESNNNKNNRKIMD
ncbi:unnamed protein product [Rotaria magnacalcarata]|uniref:Uncharacterized protein n=1 Tax=Rotaria magnacalcarata TaxID=392030 RepID=A0A816RL72_9BILA|nr:unnamed protein product [Rotaria magnacalcarata]